MSKLISAAGEPVRRNRNSLDGARVRDLHGAREQQLVRPKPFGFAGFRNWNRSLDTRPSMAREYG
ncbi:hypothetical protein [Streptomyces longisporoflavus]|uniref:Uncharacterized protein n=1 Tax=Streptomyces longisporoflavus TaxID=28044 RepID=A0ABW7QSD7_9ACTN